MNTLLIAAAVVCQWDMTPQKSGAGAATAWDMSPLKRESKIATAIATGYPARGGTRYWVYINRVAYSASPEHLLQGEHVGMFDEGWLRSLSQEDLNWLHSHAHADRVDWKYAKRPGEWEKPVAGAGKPVKMKLVRTTVCVNGRCQYQDVWVKDE